MRIKAILLLIGFICMSFVGYLVTMDIETTPPVLKHDNLSSREIVYFGVISRYSPRSIIAGYQPLMDYLTTQTPYYFKLKLSRNYLETVQQLTDGDVDFASLGNYTYIKTKVNHSIHCIAMPINSSGNLNNFDDIVVANQSPIRSVSDLKGHSFAFASKQSFSSWMAIWMLHEAGVKLSDLSNYENFKYHDLVADRVLSGNFEAGMVKSTISKKYQNKGLRILKRSPHFPSVPLVAGAHVPKDKVIIVQRALLNLKTIIEKGSISTDGWDDEVANGFEAGNDSLYNFPRNIIKQVEAIR